MKNSCFLVLLALLPWCSIAETPSELAPIDSRIRVIIDNDFGGDPDGLYQLAHHLLSPSVSVRGVIASGHYAEGFYGQPGSVEFSAGQARELLGVMQLQDTVQLFGGVAVANTHEDDPADREAAHFIGKGDVQTPSFSNLARRINTVV